MLPIAARRSEVSIVKMRIPDLPAANLHWTEQSWRLIKVERKYFPKFLEAEGPNRHRETLRETARIYSSRLVDSLKYMLIGCVQRFEKFFENGKQRRKAANWQETHPTLCMMTVR